MKQEYTIIIHGCDDRTTFKMKLTEDEYNLLKRVSALSVNKSTYSCMPVFKVHVAGKEKGRWQLDE